MLYIFFFTCSALLCSAAAPPHAHARVLLQVHPEEEVSAAAEGRRRRRTATADVLQGLSLRGLVEEDEAMLQADAHAIIESVPAWAWGSGGTALVLVTVYLLVLRKRDEPQEPSAENIDTTASTREEACEEKSEKQAEEMIADFESLLKTMAQTVTHKIGPKLVKGQALRSILETRLFAFPEKAKTFVMNELNGTAGALMKAVEAEEAMILLDLDKAVTSKFPPISILLAGLVSPTMLSFSYTALLSQLFIVILPVLTMCSWALFKDRDAACSIPTMHLWAQGQLGIAIFLGIANGMVALKIVRGKRALDAKTERMQQRLEVVKQKSANGLSASDFRELFVCNSVLIEEALLLEDEVKASIWFNAVGVGTILWILTEIWTFVLVVGWTFVPGVTAFSESASGAENYCGAWATVLTARISCILAILFLIVNFLTVFDWLCTVMMSSQSFASSVLQKARDIDKKGLGFPIAEVLVKALLLRGRHETMGSQLSIAMTEQAALEKEQGELQRQLQAVEAQLATRGAEVEAIRAKAAQAKEAGVADPLGFGPSIKQLESADIEVMGEEWKRLGQEAVLDAEARAAALAQTTTEELERLMNRLMQLAEGFQETEAFKQMAAKAEELQHSESYRAIAERAQQTVEQASVVGAHLQESAPDSLQEAMQQMSTKAEELQNSESYRSIAAKAQQAVEQASAVGSQGEEPAPDTSQN